MKKKIKKIKKIKRSELKKIKGGISPHTEPARRKVV